MRHASVLGVIAFAAAAVAAIVLLPAAPLEATEAAGASFGGTPPPSARAAADVASGIEAPRWDVGYAWRVSFPLTGSSCWLAVVEASEDGYLQGWSCEGAHGFALEDAVMDVQVYGRMGPLLSGEDAGEPVRFFDWPLTDGKTWELALRGVTYEARAGFLPDLVGPNGPEPGYRITVGAAGATAGTSNVFSYDYLPSIGWWSAFVAPTFQMQVEAFEPSFSGEALTATAAGSRYGMTFAPLFPQQAISVAEEDDLVVLTFRMTGGDTYGAQLEVEDPGGQQAYRRTLTHLSGMWLRETFEATPGNWRMTLAGVGSGNFELMVHTVRFTEWQL